jgi:hypothetical protein
MQATGTQMIDVPYKGSGAGIGPALGQTQVMFDAVASVAPHVKAGKLKILAVGAEKRSPYLPEVPTMQEAGVPGYAMASWGAVIVPAKTPKPIVDFLYREIAAVLPEPDVKERMAAMLAEVIANAGEAARLMNADERVSPNSSGTSDYRPNDARRPSGSWRGDPVSCACRNSTTEPRPPTLSMQRPRHASPPSCANGSCTGS